MKKRQDGSGILKEEIRRFVEEMGLSDDLDRLVESIESSVKALIAEEARLRRNRKRISQNDDAKEHRSALSYLTEAEIGQLPAWVQEEIQSAVVLGKAGDIVQTKDGRKYHRKNRLNDLSGGEWTYFLNSVINTRYPTTGSESYAHQIRKVHPSPKPPQLMRQIIEFFTKNNEVVIDFFMGVGGTLIGASLCERRAIGIDINGEYVEAYKAACLELEVDEQLTLVGDAREILQDGSRLVELLEHNKASLVLIDPPYGDMMSRAKTGEAAKLKKNVSPTPFTSSSSDLGNMPSEEFLTVLASMVSDSLRFLKERGHVVVFMKDLQPTKDCTNLLHAEVISALVKIDGLSYLGMKIWADQGVNLYPYGYPYSFVSNQIHQYIMIFRKN